MEQKVAGTLRVANNIFFKEVKEILSTGKDVLFTINGNSMKPFLSHGDKVIISPASDKDLSLGKIILANSKYGYVLHRLVWKTDRKICLAGDNNLVQIEYVEKEDIHGYVKYAVVNGKRISVLSASHIFLAFCWFLARPVRLLIFKILRLFRLK